MKSRETEKDLNFKAGSITSEEKAEANKNSRAACETNQIKNSHGSDVAAKL